ncbi:unnamed protein product [Heterobilharzia americana]|nr:unnamed protein product [Heterobilharzia americana]
MNTGAKWPCAVCTYENWPAAFKCTLCGTPRSPTLIEDEMQRLHLSSKDSEKIDECRVEAAFDATQMIKCQSCTYLNQRQNFKCEQCFQVLYDSPVLDVEVSKQASSTWLSPPPPPLHPPHSLTSLSPSGKWACIECTYENWPKSKHCTMCFAPPPPICANVCNETDNKDYNATCASSNSSSSNVVTRRAKSNLTNTSLTSRDRLWLSACVAVASGEVAPIERYILANGRIERKLTKHECRYLNSHFQSTTICDVPTGLSNNDYSSRQTDDIKLSLLSDDSSCLPQRATIVSSDSGLISSNLDYASSPIGYKFRSGWTLVDLALRFCRTDLINLFIALIGLHATSSAISIGSGSKHFSLLVNSSSITPSATTVVTAYSTTTTSCATANTVASAATPSVCNTNNINPRNNALNNPIQDVQTQGKTNQGSRKLSSPLTGNQIHPALQLLFNRTPGSINKTQTSRSKWMPCQASPHIAGELRDLLAKTVKHRKGDFPCAYFAEWGTFALPHSITKFPAPVKQLLLSELCDMQAQSELEDDAKAINWWFIPGQKQSNRLFALWNRTSGDCLLDSVLQACWGVFDRENCLRHALAESLQNCEANFYPRWRDYEALQAACHYILDEDQCQRDWENVLAAACQPREALEQIHIFALSHVLRRPIIVYGVKYIKNYRGEPIGIANFQGIYLPLLWEKSFCSRNPIVLGFTRGHFTALVPIEPYPIFSNTANAESSAETNQTTGTSCSPYQSPRTSCSSRKHSPTPPDEASTYTQLPLTTVPLSTSISDAQLASVLEPSSNGGVTTISSAISQQNAFVYLPLVDRQGALLPIHFTTEKEAKLSHTLLQDWLDVVCTRRGLPLARLRLHAKHTLVENMVDEWLDSYRSLARVSVNTIPTLSTTTITTINTNTTTNIHLISGHSSSSTSVSSDTDHAEQSSKSISSEDAACGSSHP